MEWLKVWALSSDPSTAKKKEEKVKMAGTLQLMTEKKTEAAAGSWEGCVSGHWAHPSFIL
jgi:hypothetical protein